MMNSQFTSKKTEGMVETPQFSLPPDGFAEAFPFHLVFNRDTKLMQIGKVLQRLYPELCVGSQLEDHFHFQRPSIPIQFQAILERSGSFFLLESLSNGMKLRGQMIFVEQSETLVFLGSPWITDLEELSLLGLKLKDFAIHDPVVDFLFLLQAKNTAIADAKNLADKLSSQQGEISKALKKEQELSTLKSHFVTTISHEFRTPLAKILGSTELLEHYSYKWAQEKKQIYFQRIKGSIQHLTQMLNDVLLLYEAQMGTLNLYPVPMNLVEFCQNLVQELQSNYGNQHKMTFINRGFCTEAHLDEKMIKQMLNNLFSNAIKYSSPGSPIYLELACQDEVASFQVQDQGLGIDSDDRKHLFERFHRGKNIGNIPGTGLGLAFVKKVVELHQGEIAVSSEVGVGTTITVTIPLNQTIQNK